ncbi:holo-ACP synthase [Micromonospora sp. Llam7]|uniref:holo-ACP synthase n=1 Tax=Micromonospora tarapacensis TaxID=2835305 RepID=UPI001C834936|nr:holo-ACP synthase [Micromonospora tarapacensis]MBX7266514.1 holo-ACP synthase [Micromonospora tarapacensis]
MRLGVDLVEIARISRIAAHPGGRRLVFTAAELAHADTLGQRRATEYLAGRFGAKEAVAKVLGRGLGQGLVWRDIEVVADRYGAPTVTLRGGARAVATAAGIDRVEVSLSHQGGLVVCVAAALPGAAGASAGDDPDPGWRCG